MILGKYKKNIIGTMKLRINRIDGCCSAEVLGRLDRRGRMTETKYNTGVQATNALKNYYSSNYVRTNLVEKYDVKLNIIHPIDNCWYIGVTNNILK